MTDDKISLLWGLASSLGVAITLPYIVYKVFRAVYINKAYGSLAGKVVVITGASSGLGEAMAHEFFKSGCQVVLCARRRQELDRVREELLQKHSIVPTNHPVIVPLDLSEIDSLEDTVNKILAITGHIDILINNGGISNRGSVMNTKADVYMQIMKVNFFGSAMLTKAVLPNMIARRQGQIVSISSVQGLMAIPDRSAYSASKHAMQAFNDSLRAEVNEHNIQVTVISPGYIRTQISMNALTETGAKHAKMDTSTESGYSPEYVAGLVLKAVVLRKNEVVIATFLVRLAIFLRKHLPGVYFYVMAFTAKKGH